MNKETKEYLMDIADQHCMTDDSDFSVEYHAGSDVNKAYKIGREDGKIIIARILLDMEK